MLHALFQVLLYSVVAALSPLAVAALVAVMHAGRTRVLAFGIGFVAGQLATSGLFVVLGVAATRDGGASYPWLQVVLALALAAALVWLAGVVRRRPPVRHASPRTRAMLERLSRVGVFTAGGTGLALGVGGPKRLLLAALAATAVTTSGLRHTGETALVILYVAIATVVVWVPVILYVILGDRAADMIKQVQDTVRERQPQVTVGALYVLATLCVVEAGGIVVTQLL